MYLEDVPSYRFASKHIKKSEDTTKRWRDEDPDFAEQCEQRVSAWVKKTLRKAKPEFQLERLLRDDFSQRTEIVGKDGKDLIPAPLLGGQTTHVPSDNSNSSTS